MSLTPHMTTMGEPLLPQLELADAHCRQQRGMSVVQLKHIMVTVFVSVALAVGIFVGGYFLGHHDGGNWCDPHGPQGPMPVNPAMPAVTSLEFTYNGQSVVLDAIAGSVPVDSFMQCVVSTVQNEVGCVPTNAVLTVPGGVLLTLYQYGGTTNMIVTGTGSSFGYANANPANIEANFSVHINGLEAEVHSLTALAGAMLVEPTVPFSSGPVVLSEAGTLSVVFTVLNINPTFLASVALSGNTGTLGLFVMGSNMQPIRVGATLPSVASPLLLAYSAVAAAQSAPMSPMGMWARSTTTLQSSQQGTIYYTSMQSPARRSLWGDITTAAHWVNVGLQVWDALDSTTGYSMEFSPPVHGSAQGLNLNFTRFSTIGAFANASVTMGMSGNNQLVINGGLTLNASALATFTTSVVNDVSSVASSAATAAATSVHCLESNGPLSTCLSNALTSYTTSLPTWVPTAITAVQQYLGAAGQNVRRDSCAGGVVTAAGSAANCGADIAGEWGSWGLDTIFTVADCIHAGVDVYNAYHDC